MIMVIIIIIIIPALLISKERPELMIRYLAVNQVNSINVYATAKRPIIKQAEQRE
jgi:hypothetical protein